MMGLMALAFTVKAYAAPVNGESARLLGMASNVYTTEDLDSIFLYPNKVLEYSNIANIRGLASFGNEWGGLIMKDDAIGAMGVYTNEPFANLADNNAANRVDLMWANSFSGTSVGVGLNYSNTSDNGANTDRDIAIKLGVGLPTDMFSQLNIHAGYEMGSQTVNNTSTPNSPSIITAGALAQKDLDANNNLRMFVDFGTDSNLGWNKNDSYTNIQLGLAGNRKVNDGKGLVSTGLIIGYTNQTGTADNFNLNWNGGVESKVADWLTARTGISKLIYNGQNNNLATFNFAMGASINWQNFTLDLNVNPASFENTITNIQPGNGIFYGNDANNTNNNLGAILTVSEADLTYKF